MSKRTIRKRTFTLVGMSYRVTTPMRRELVEHLPFDVAVEREPLNTHDGNAIQISIGDKKVPLFPMRIGYLRRQVAEVLAPALDLDEITIGKAKLVAIDVGQGTGQVEVWLKMASTKGKFTLDKRLKL
jgi:HIRAN domain